MTTITQNKDTVRRYFDALSRGDIEGVMKEVDPSFMNHAAIPTMQGPEGLRVILTKLHDAMPDQRLTCEDLIAEGDLVVARVTLRGTQTGALQFTRFQLPASGRTVETIQIHIFRMKDGKMVEHWAGHDHIGLLRQLGHSPFAPPTQQPARTATSS